ncbi:phospholipase A1-Igamma1 [Cucumis melo var. makuwa]|nr:phospholipase A1-Igamma1, chloroplastic [Cucumis melo]KAA0054030.1 phospholipase A1-Igamma1 [Cucumis melo var. makuwa]TYK20716.1 phospholipase A1-Igamma1 [Cucumis melo var. makuwa]
MEAKLATPRGIPVKRTTMLRNGTKKTKWYWKLKLGIRFRAIKAALSSSLHNQRRRLTCSTAITTTTTPQLTPTNGLVSPLVIHQSKPSKKNDLRLAKPLASLLRMPLRAADFIDFGNHMTPTLSPRDNISAVWRDLHGASDWEGLLDPLHPFLRREIVKYGEFAQATYDAFDFDPLSEFCGSCRYNRHKLLNELGLAQNGYKVTKYIYALSPVDGPDWFESSKIGEVWSRDSNWMGYVAVSSDEESDRIGRRDILVAWRGTVTPTEWYIDLKTKLKKIDRSNKKVKVQRGFLTIYKSKDEDSKFNKTSASEQVMEELHRLIDFFKEKGDREISLTITGHSLGGALSLLTAYEAGVTFPADVHVSVVSFGAPRVGNLAFREKLNEMGVKTLRVVIRQDIVPKLPGLFVNSIVNKLGAVTGKLNWVYRHVGKELRMNMYMSPYLKKDSDMSGSHNLEIYLHLVDGFVAKKGKFRWNSRRDVALVNKGSDMLVEELRIPEFWYQLPHKGLIKNRFGRWVKPGRNPEDIPSPFSQPLQV